jgi:hypothetical protein
MYVSRPTIEIGDCFGLSLMFLEFLPPGYFVFIYGSEGLRCSPTMALSLTRMMAVIQGSEGWKKDVLHIVVYKLRTHMIWPI